MKLAILTDIHANYTALEAVLADINKQKELHQESQIELWFLGDLVGYGPQPAECVRWFHLNAKLDERWLPGNHDEFLWDYYREQQAGKSEDELLKNLSNDAKFSLTRHANILQEARYKRHGAWFLDQVKAHVEDGESGAVKAAHWGDVSAFFAHGTLSQPYRQTYLFPWKKVGMEREFIELENRIPDTTSLTVLFLGHTHFPMFVKQQDNRAKLLSIGYGRPLSLAAKGQYIINPGSVGQPRDRDPRAAYVLFDPEKRTVEFRRIDYEIEKTVFALRSGGYSPSLIQRVQEGDLGENGSREFQQFQDVYEKWDLVAKE